MVCEITDVRDETSRYLLAKSLKHYIARELIVKYRDLVIYEEIEYLLLETPYDLRKKIITILSSKKHDIFMQLSNLAKKKGLGEKQTEAIG